MSQNFQRQIPLQGHQMLQQGNVNRNMWQSLWSQNQKHQRQQMMMNKKVAATATGTTIHGKVPMLMANNDVFCIGPYKARKDSMRVSVLDKYEVIGYIAAGTYGKVYKAKRRVPVDDNSDDLDASNHMTSPVLSGRNASTLANQQAGSQNLNDSDDQGRFRSPTHMNGNVKESNHSRGANGSHPSNSGQNNRGNGSAVAFDNLKDTYQSAGSETSPGFVSPTKKREIPVFYAIKKFKTEKEGVEQLHHTGISQSACREMSLCRELDNKHLTKLSEIFLEKKSIYMVYEYAEHDLLQIIHYHSHPEKRMIPARMIRSIMWQILDGVSYLHQNWILHRDLKPANIMVTVNGCIKIGDLGLARKFSNLLQTLYTGDKVVVTIWYRAPELLLGARHYTPSIDIWAVGCIFAELIGLQPIFKGEEAKMDSKKTVPFQGNQLQRILEVLGTPTPKVWTNLTKYPEYHQFLKFPKYRDSLPAWYRSTGGGDKNVLDLLYKLLAYDPTKRIDAVESLEHSYFTNGDYPVSENIFEGLNYKCPARRIHTGDNDIMNSSAQRGKALNSSQQGISNTSTGALGGLGVNRRILAAAAAASNSGSQGMLRPNEPLKKRRL